MTTVAQDDAVAAAVACFRQVEAAQHQVHLRRAELGGAIRAALSADVPSAVLAKQLGFTRSRIYQLAKLAE